MKANKVFQGQREYLFREPLSLDIGYKTKTALWPYWDQKGNGEASQKPEQVSSGVVQRQVTDPVTQAPSPTAPTQAPAHIECIPPPNLQASGRQTPRGAEGAASNKPGSSEGRAGNMWCREEGEGSRDDRFGKCLF